MSNDLIELIRLMNEKPIAFNKHYVFLGCGINGAVMLSQLVYWADKSKDPNGWIYKTGKEWTEETGLTRREQDTARKNLRELGFIDEHKHGVPCKVHFKVNQSNLYSALISLAHKRQTDAQISQTECTEEPNLIGGIRQTNTESTSDITSKNTHIINRAKKSGVKKFDPLNTPIPKHINYKTWCDFVEMRKQIKKPLTERATVLIINKLVEFGVNGNASLEQSIASGWSSVFAVKQNNTYQSSQQRTAQEHDKWRIAEQQSFGEKDVTPVNKNLIGEYRDV